MNIADLLDEIEVRVEPFVRSKHSSAESSAPRVLGTSQGTPALVRREVRHKLMRGRKNPKLAQRKVSKQLP